MGNFEYKDVDFNHLPIAKTYCKEGSIRMRQNLDKGSIDRTVERNDGLIQVFGSADGNMNESDRSTEQC